MTTPALDNDSYELPTKRHAEKGGHLGAPVRVARECRSSVNVRVAATIRAHRHIVLRHPLIPVCSALRHDANDHQLNASIDRVFAEKAGVEEVQEQLGLQAAEIKRLDQDSKDSANALRVVMETLEDTMPIEVRATAQPQPNRPAALAQPPRVLTRRAAARRTRTTC